MRELQMIAIVRKADIIGITEVSLKYTKEVLYTNIEEVEVTRNVEVYIVKHLALRADEIKTDTVCKKGIWIQLNLSESTKVMLVCTYRSPTSSPANDDNLHKLLDESNSRDPSQVILMGDFNQPEIDWNTKTTEKGMYRPSQLFLDAVRATYLLQYIDTPTRFRMGRTHIYLTYSSQVKTEPEKGDYKKINQNLLEIDWETDLKQQKMHRQFSPSC